MSKQDLEADFSKNDGESIEDYASKCRLNGWVYTGWFSDGKPVLERLQ